MIKGIIFDLDGVLTTTDHFHYLAWKQMADEEGIYFDQTINNRLRGVSRMDSLNIILEKASKDYSLEEKCKLAEKKNTIYQTLLTNLAKLDEDSEVIKVLKYLKSLKYLMAIASSSKNTNFIVDQIGIREYFDVIVDGNMITKSKPDPEVFLKAKDQLKLEVNECLVIEDATSGIEAAIKGGFITCGIGEASKMKECQYPLTTLSDLLNILQMNK